jgi:hypothetical protein
MSTIEKPPPRVEMIDAGGIDDARRRHRRHRRYGVAIGLAVVVAGVLAYVALMQTDARGPRPHDSRRPRR